MCPGIRRQGLTGACSRLDPGFDQGVHMSTDRTEVSTRGMRLRSFAVIFVVMLAGSFGCQAVQQAPPTGDNVLADKVRTLILTFRNIDYHVRDEAVEKITEIGPVCVPSLIAALEGMLIWM